MLAERALQDRTWAYGHVIVDEAQELSAMAWRMVLRRCPARSMTVVGDLAQTSRARRSRLVGAGTGPGRRRTLAHRTADGELPHPQTRHDAGRRAPAAGRRPAAVRARLGREPVVRRAEDLADLVRRETELIGTGRVAVIAPSARAAETAAVLSLSPGPDLDAPVAVLTPEQAKGLEFDSVIVVDPAGIEQASPRGRADLYVALTRTTRRLGLVMVPALGPAGRLGTRSGRVLERDEEALGRVPAPVPVAGGEQVEQQPALVRA